MSVSFYIRANGQSAATDLNMANGNAADLFRWLGIEPDLWTAPAMLARDLAVACRRRSWDVQRNHDPAREPVESGGPGTGQCRLVECGRPADYLRGRAAALLAVCEQALAADPDAHIYWG